MPVNAASFHFGQALLPQGWARDVRVTVADGMIMAVTSDSALTPTDERHAIVLPGLPNLHSHAFQRGMAGLGEKRGSHADSFWTWREAMYRFLARMGPEDLEAIAALAYIEMLESGFTRVGEFHYLHHAPDGTPYANPAEMSVALAAAAQETGIALTLLPVFYAHAGFGAQPPGEGQRRFVTGLDAFAVLREKARVALKALPDAVLGLAPHSLRAVTPDELSALAAMGGDAPFHIHIAEQTREVEDCLAWSGARPVAWLLDHAPVDRRWCLVHATHMVPEETRALAASGAVAGLCPITEANLGDGFFPAQGYLDAGGAWGIGSDSNVMIDAAEELRWLEYGQRLHRRGRNLIAREGHSGGALIAGALEGGGRALGAAAGLAVGSPADFLTLDPGHPSLACREGDALLDGWIFAGGRGCIDGVWRRGLRMVTGGRHHAREAVVARYLACLRRLIG